MALLGLLSVARDALTAQTAALSVVGQNVANANTPGYVRRTPRLATRALGEQSGGVRFEGVQRQFDRFAFRRVALEEGRRGASRAQAEALAGLEGVVAPEAESLGVRISSFFAGLHALVASPQDAAVRGDVLVRAEALARSFSDTASAVAQGRTDLLARAQDVAGELNERLTSIAKLNGEIHRATGLGVPADDLRDDRDRLVREVADRIGAQVVEDDAGHFTLFASGLALVEGDRASSVGVDLNQGGALRITVTRPGGNVTDVTSRVTDGSLAGIRTAREVDYPAVMASLDQLAFDFVTSVNAAHAQGFGLDGVSGRPLFEPPGAVAGAARAVKLDASIAGQPQRLAAAESLGALPGGNGNALALAKLAYEPLGATTMSPNERFGAVAAQVGSARRAAEQDLSLREATVAQAEAVRDSGAGVSIDEEMVDLTRYQRAYEASIRVLRTADELLADLMRSL
jgi:flagellar hook-associated protein 1 FlgK